MVFCLSPFAATAATIDRRRRHRRFRSVTRRLRVDVRQLDEVRRLGERKACAHAIDFAGGGEVVFEVDPLARAYQPRIIEHDRELWQTSAERATLKVSAVGQRADGLR